MASIIVPQNKSIGSGLVRRSSGVARPALAARDRSRQTLQLPPDERTADNRSLKHCLANDELAGIPDSACGEGALKMSVRKQRARIHRLQQDIRSRRLESSLEDRLWDRMPPIGREFGSPDFERLMEEDFRLGRGVFDPATSEVFPPRWRCARFESERGQRTSNLRAPLVPNEPNINRSMCALRRARSQAHLIGRIRS